MLNEELLFTWLQLGNVIDNQRLVSGMSFNEAMVCGLLVRAQRAGGSLTASELCAQTRILKSQMNVILRSLEREGLLLRQRSQTDLRRIELRLSPEGLERYSDAHRRVLVLVDRLISAMGEDAVRTLIPLLRQVVEVFDIILQEA